MQLAKDAELVAGSTSPQVDAPGLCAQAAVERRICDSTLLQTQYVGRHVRIVRCLLTAGLTQHVLEYMASISNLKIQNALLHAVARHGTFDCFVETLRLRELLDIPMNACVPCRSN